ncbi:MAG: hypothetical protein M3376_14430 [Actinomycetota bacterium]|nr:hypothetical protein [Actinomycetota bacterium]
MVIAGCFREEIHDLAARPDGSLVALGSLVGDRSRRLFVAGFTPGGERDPRFGRDGRANAGLLRAPRGVDVRRLSRAHLGGAISTGPGRTTVGVAFLGGPDGSAVRWLVFRLDRRGVLDRRFGRRGVKLVGSPG